MHEWLGRRAGVYGYGKTGKACVEYLLPRMVSPVVLVDKPSAALLQQLMADAAGRFEFAAGADVAAAVEGIDSLILSPGVPLSNPVVLRARERGVPVVSELELASRYCHGYIIAVTGTNGKSTTTKLLGHVLSALGPTHVLGNIGDPLLGSLDAIGPGDFVALEVSSFQLEAVERFCPRIAIYTNLTPDHIDRHGTVEEYTRVKRSMTDRMGADCFIITNALCREFAPEQFINQQPRFLQYRSLPGNRIAGCWLANNTIHVDLGAETFELPLDCVKLPGVHNLENAMAVILAALVVGASPDTIAGRLSTFTGYEHRLELCRREAGLAFFNDSKATNPEATITALKAMEAPLALILGGRDKMTDLTDMVAWIKRKVLRVLLIGEAAERFAAALTAMGYNAYDRVERLDQALALAVQAMQPGGGTVLLSPACASFDQYTGYEERGEHFKQLVSQLQL